MLNVTETILTAHRKCLQEDLNLTHTHSECTTNPPHPPNSWINHFANLNKQLAV